MNPLSRTVLALLLGGLMAPLAAAAEPTPDEQRLLGSNRDEAQLEAYMPFTRSIGAGGLVKGTLAQSAAEAGVPPAAMLEALDALGAAIDLQRDVREGDRFYVRYERSFTAAGDPIGVGRVLWVELRTQAKGTVALHRFRPMKAATDTFFLSTGSAATSAGLKLPLDAYTVSSGFGMRADPFDQPYRGFVARAAPAAATASGKPANAKSATPGPAAASAAGASPFVNPAFAKGGPEIAASPLLNPVNVPTAAGVQMGLVGPGAAAAWRGTVTHANGAGVSTGRSGAVMAMHEGVDLAAPMGTPIHAAGDGVIRGAELKGGYGNWIEIDHEQLQGPVINGKPGKIATVYGHLSAFAPGIAPGVRVKQGEVIGFVGSTGRSTGPHLHFEIRQNDHPTNPMISLLLRTEQLKGGDLDRFQKTVARDLAERQSEAGSI